MIKPFIGFLLKKLPRTFLQRISKPIFNIISIFYNGDNVNCPICRKSFNKFFPYGREVRDNALCTNCLSLERHRLLYLFLIKKTSLFNDKCNVLHIAPEGCLINVFRGSDNINYTTADLYSPLADIKMDIHKMPFENNSFDFILCNHVLEHVENDIIALKEIKRVMKKGGLGIVQVPFYNPIPKKTFEDKSIKTDSAREIHFGQSDHVRKYGKDYKKRLESVGFNVKCFRPQELLNNSQIKKYGVLINEDLYTVSI